MKKFLKNIYNEEIYKNNWKIVKSKDGFKAIHRLDKSLNTKASSVKELKQKIDKLIEKALEERTP